MNGKISIDRVGEQIIEWGDYKKAVTKHNDYKGEISCCNLECNKFDSEIIKKLNLDESYLIIGYEFSFGVPDVQINVQLIKKDIITCISDLENTNSDLHIEVKKVKMELLEFIQLVDLNAKVFTPNILNTERNVILKS